MAQEEDEPWRGADWYETIPEAELEEHEKRRLGLMARVMDVQPVDILMSYFEHGETFFFDTEHGHISSFNKMDRPYRSRLVLEHLHEKYAMSQKEMADALGCTKATITRWVEKNDIELNGRWEAHNGSLWEEERQRALKRDGGCVVCGMTRDEHREWLGREPPVHHVIPREHFEAEKKAHFPANLVVLCEECHRPHEGMSPRQLFLAATSNGEDT